MSRSHSADLDLQAFNAGDPLDVLRYSARFGPAAVAEIEDSLVRAELAAVRSAAPTAAGAQAIRSCVTSGRLAAIVSNNSTHAIREYLARHDLTDLVHTVVGRIYAEPLLMKPDAEPVRRALEALSAPPAVAVLIGDSPSDVTAAQAAATACIGFANKPSKWQRLADADVTIDDMAVLVHEFETTPVDSPAPRT